MGDSPILFWSRSPQWGWLSNFAPTSFAGPDSKLWTSVEHWYQAGKATSLKDAERIRHAPTAQQAQRLGRTIQYRKNWNNLKLQHMATGLKLRFTPGSPDTARLLATGNRPLHHATPWGKHGDPFWGIGRNGNGANHLGKMLEEVRNERQMYLQKELPL